MYTARNQCQIFPEKELRDFSPNFHMHVSMSDFYIHTMDLPILADRHMNAKIGNAVAQFPEK
jgi:hypothetical protein